MKLVDEFLKMYMSSQHLYEMGRYGKFAEFSVHVYGGEKRIPHFHFIKKQAKKNQPKEGCVCLETAEYFIHPGKTATLNRDEREDLMKFLQSIEPSFKVSYYEYLCNKWNENNHDNKDAEKIKDFTAMPDYLNDL